VLKRQPVVSDINNETVLSDAVLMYVFVHRVWKIKVCTSDLNNRCNVIAKD